VPVEEPAPDERAGEENEQQGQIERRAAHRGSVALRLEPVKLAKGDDNPA
jgi:hypothetical protein